MLWWRVKALGNISVYSDSAKGVDIRNARLCIDYKQEQNECYYLDRSLNLALRIQADELVEFLRQFERNSNLHDKVCTSVVPVFVSGWEVSILLILYTVFSS